VNVIVRGLLNKLAYTFANTVDLELDGGKQAKLLNERLKEGTIPRKRKRTT